MKNKHMTIMFLLPSISPLSFVCHFTGRVITLRFTNNNFDILYNHAGAPDLPKNPMPLHQVCSKYKTDNK